MFCIHWFKSVKWKKSWPYRPPVSDDDEGITAVEATGGESVQLQRVHCAVVLTFCKQPEGWEANVWLLQDSIWLCCHRILNIRGIRHAVQTGASFHIILQPLFVREIPEELWSCVYIMCIIWYSANIISHSLKNIRCFHANICWIYRITAFHLFSKIRSLFYLLSSSIM